jgi:hypothetical protein
MSCVVVIETCVKCMYPIRDLTQVHDESSQTCSSLHPKLLPLTQGLLWLYCAVSYVEATRRT